MSVVTPTAGRSLPLVGRQAERGRIMPKRGSMPRYRVTGGPDGTAGIQYKTKRAEAGDIVEDVPRESIKWLREQGYIEMLGKDDTPDPSAATDVSTDNLKEA